MSKGTFTLLIDLLAAIALTVLVATGYLLWFVLPPGTNRTHELLGWLRHEWGEVHFWVAALLLAVLAVHVALHWRWLSMSLCKRLGLSAMTERRPAWAGAALLIVAVVPLVTVAIVSHTITRPLQTPLHQPPPPSLQSLALESRVAQLVSDRCAECHSGEAPAADVRADTVAWLLIEQDGTRWVTPGDATTSPIFQVLHDEATPARGQRRHVVSESELATLQDWVQSLRR